jgi:hypothetical protein
MPGSAVRLAYGRVQWLISHPAQWEGQRRVTGAMDASHASFATQGLGGQPDAGLVGKDGTEVGEAIPEVGERRFTGGWVAQRW